MLNLPPRTQQTKRVMPRSYLRAVKKPDEQMEVKLGRVMNPKHMKAYKDALMMFDRIKNIGSEEGYTDHVDTEEGSKKDQILEGDERIGLKHQNSDKIEINIPNEKAREKVHELDPNLEYSNRSSSQKMESVTVFQTKNLGKNAKDEKEVIQSNPHIENESERTVEKDHRKSKNEDLIIDHGQSRPQVVFIINLPTYRQSRFIAYRKVK
jgi:hypothetical protein